jgi:hypothetical protein
VRELQMFRRLLAEGIRPRWVLAEVWTPFLTQRKGFAEDSSIRLFDLQPADATLVSRYFADPWPAYEKLAESTLAPAFGLRLQLLAAYSPFVDRPLQYPPGDWSDPSLRTVEAYGWLPVPDPRPDPEVYRDRVAAYADCLRDVLTDFQISPVADRALRDLLETCAAHDIRIAFVLVPEHSSVRACSLPAVQARMNAYLAELTGDYRVPVIDTRDWVSDDDFVDSRHTLPPVAAPYTERFGREILQPLLKGQPLSRQLLLGTAPSPDLPARAH